MRYPKQTEITIVKKFGRIGLSLAAFLTLFIPLSPSQKTGSSSLVLDNVKIVNSVEPQERENMSIVIKDGWIAEVVETSECKPSPGTLRINLAGKCVIPGLIEGHVHLRTLPDAQLANALRWGITSIRSMADDASYIQLLKRAIAEGRLEGPDIYFAAAFGGRKLFEEDLRATLYSSSDYPVGQAPWLQMVTEAGDLRKMVQKAKDCGATGIKLLNYLTPDQAGLLASHARRLGMKIWSHPHLTFMDAKMIALAKVDLITHASNLILPVAWNLKEYGGRAMDADALTNGRLDEILAIMKENHILFEPTFCVCLEQLAQRETEDAAKTKEGMAVEIARRARAAGLNFVAGTDMDLPKTEDEKPYLFKEIRYFAERIGMTPAEALKSATLNGALALGIEKTHGSIEAGKAADMVVLNEDPSVEAAHLESVVMVIKNGRILKRNE